MHMRALRWCAVMTVALSLVACSSGGGGEQAGGDFVVLQTTPSNNGKLFLNEPIHLDFTQTVDLTSADLNTVAFQVFDLNGQSLDERPSGTFELARSPGDDYVGRRLSFRPKFPSNNAFDDGGFRPGRLYLVQLVGGDARNNNVLRDSSQNSLSQPISFQFRTADGATPSELFSDTLPGGPRRVGFSVTPRNQWGVSLNRMGLESVEVRLDFDQPLNPSDTNVPVDVSEDPSVREPSDRGRIFLEYDDSLSSGVWIPATIDLEENTQFGSTVVMRPIGVLPNNADIRVIVEKTVEDMSGESNVGDVAHDREFASFRTREKFPPQYDGLVEQFESDSNTVDADAAFLEPVAELGSGQVRAAFEFAGSEERLSYEPTVREVILNTDFTSISPKNSPPINVSGGVFSFRDVLIPESVTVRGTGTNPMVWLCTGDFTVLGTLTVDGGDGERVDTLNSANFPTPGGIGVCGSGSGGAGSPNANDHSLSGETGYGPRQRPGGGGGGGVTSCVSNCNRGAGGGGGSLGTKGDPYYPPARNADAWTQVTGEGGRGCTNRSQPGGAAGVTPFTDTRQDNNFWGSGVNVYEAIRIQGELLAPIGGAGGGGGGDRASGCAQGDPNFASDNKGGGGGAGAGVLVIQALGKITVGPSGHIDANGGNGGGGEQAGSNNEGGGGGGGSGGMIVMMAGGGFEFWVHGDENAAVPVSTYGEFDYDFAVSADGGIGTQGRFSGIEISNKYPPGTENTWNARPTGGFGGMGIVQLMSPPGEDADGTGNRLDDFISFKYFDLGGREQEVSPERKIELLAWRGWPDEAGVWTDDDGNRIDIGKAEGDIRPSPVLLPAPFGAVSRARSRWIELGAVAREPVTSNPGPDFPRVVVVSDLADAPNPDFGDPDLGFAGTSQRVEDTGYVEWVDSGGSLQADYPVISFDGETEFEIAVVVPNGSFDGQDAIRIDLVEGSSLGDVADRYAQYRVRIALGLNQYGADYRILSHSQDSLFLEYSSSPPRAGEQIQIVAKFFSVSTDGSPGLGSPAPSELFPESNTRLGFAFNTDPSPGGQGERFPAEAGQFVFDLLDPALLDFLATRRPTYVQWDVLFNTRFDPDADNNNSRRPLSPNMPMPALDYIVLPYRF